MIELDRKCPICGDRYGVALRKIKMKLPDELPIPDNYTVVSCGNCGFCFADMIATQQEYDLYYKNFNMYSSSAKLKEKVTNRACEIRYKVVKKYIDKEEKILDVGCGDGTFLLFLKDHGYRRIYGIDPSEQSIATLKEGGIEGRVGNVFEDAVEELKGTFDVVTFTAVIEHIFDLEKVIKQLSAYLKKTGKIFIDAPAVEGFEKYITPIPNYFNQEHINYFSLCSLDNLLLKNGYYRLSTNQEGYELIEATSKMESEMCLQAIYQHYGEDEEKKIIIDEISQKSIKNYFKCIDERNKDIDRKINDFIQKQDQVILWGTGSYAMQILARIPELQKKIFYFVDNNQMKQGTKLCNKEIVDPEYIKRDSNLYPIIICSMLNSKDIVEQIKEMHIPNAYITIS